MTRKTKIRWPTLLNWSKKKNEIAKFIPRCEFFWICLCYAREVCRQIPLKNITVKSPIRFFCFFLCNLSFIRRLYFYWFTACFKRNHVFYGILVFKTHCLSLFLHFYELHTHTCIHIYIYIYIYIYIVFFNPFFIYMYIYYEVKV